MARASFLRMMIHTCTVQVMSSESTDVHGQPDESWADESTEVACMWQDKSGRLGDLLVQGMNYDCLVFLVYNVDIDETRRITNVQDDNDNVIEAGPLRVIKAQNAAGRSHHTECFCRRSSILETS